MHHTPCSAIRTEGRQKQEYFGFASPYI